MISSQYGREFVKSNYEKIKKAYSIWIFTAPPTDHKNSITRYRLTEEHIIGQSSEPVQTYDLLSLIMVYLGGAGTNAENYNGILRMLDVLLSDKFKASEKRQILTDEFGIAMTQTIEREVSDMCNLSQGIKEKGIAQGISQGLAQGISQGLAQGRTEGIVNGILFSIKNLMETMGLTIEQAMTALKIPENEKQKYKDLLQQETFSKQSFTM